MSTIIVLNLPEPGHMNATYPLIEELVARGERVLYYATDPYRTEIEKTGALFKSLGPEETFKPGHHKGGLYSVMAYALGVAEKILPSLVQSIEAEKPDLFLIDSMCVWGNLIAQIFKRPAVNLCAVFATNEKIVNSDQMIHMSYGHLPPEVILNGIDALNQYMEIAKRIDQRYRTTCPNLVQFFSNEQPLNLVFNSRYFHLKGEEFDQDHYKFVGPGIDSREKGKNGCHEKQDPPLIYISMGTIFNDLPQFYQSCLEALADGPYQVILNVGEKVDLEKIAPAPANFSLITSAPQLEILKKASLFFTHGGINSTCEALWNEVPLIVYPQHGDQYLVANQVRTLGAGLVLTPPDINPSTIRDRVQKVLGNPQFKHQATKISSSFKEAGGYQKAAEEIFTYKRSLGI